MQHETNARLDLARRIAREAGQTTLKFFQQGSLTVERKSDNSPVTLADREAERLLRDRIGEAFPDDGVLGEEFGERPGTSPFQWILDPIDGTKSFISDVPLFGTMVAVEQGGRGILGVVNFPGLHVSIDAMSWSFQR